MPPKLAKAGHRLLEASRLLMLAQMELEIARLCEIEKELQHELLAAIAHIEAVRETLLRRVKA